MQRLAEEEITQNFDWDSMTGRLYHQQHKGAFLKTYVLLLKLFSETLMKKKKGEEKVCCIVSYLTKHSPITSNKQIKNKVQPSRIKIYNRICLFFLMDAKETGVEEKEAYSDIFTGNFKARWS